MDKLQEGLKAYQEKIASGEIERTEASYNWIVQAERKPTSKHKAIKAMCFHCMGGTKDSMPDPGWKKMIDTCTAPDCPLFSHRPRLNSETIATDAINSDEI
jgi:hypothetical protein